MSIRSHTNRINSFIASTPSNPIDFRDDFVNSAAVYAASTDETVSQIMQRLDQLQSKIATNEQQATPAAPRARAVVANADISSRVATLESIHEDTMQRLAAKLEVVERKLNENREMESLMGQISSKFGKIESQLNASKESEGLINKVANKFSAVESRLQSATQLSDRVAQLESRLGSHSDLHSRISRLESSLAPDPEQERLISRISAKLDKLERARPEERSTDEPAFLGASADREDRINYLQTRIEKLKELRSRYESDLAE